MPRPLRDREHRALRVARTRVRGLATNTADVVVAASASPSRTSSSGRARAPLDPIAVSAGAVVALVIAVALFTRFSIDEPLTRDEAIYAYGGQLQAEGVPFYRSIFDMKTPLAPMLAGAAVAVGRTIDVDDVYAIRALFFTLACLTVVAVYLLAAWLFESALVGLVSAATFSSFKGFALDALTGPNAKTPGVLFAVLSMALLVRRHHFWGAFAGSAAFLVWQPLAVYAVVAIAAAAIADERERSKRVTRALAGASLPVAVTAAYFWLEEALDDLIDGAFVLPLTHLERKEESVVDRLTRLSGGVDRMYGGPLLWIGLAAVLAVVTAALVRRRSRFALLPGDASTIVIIGGSFLAFVAFTASDYQRYPDLYPMLPYAAIGVGAVAKVLPALADSRNLRFLAAALSLGLVGVLVAWSWSRFSVEPPRATALVEQRARTAVLERLLDDDDTLYSFGNPMPLVLMNRRSPTRYVYLDAGVDRWAIGHTPGGLAGFTREIARNDPALIIVYGPWGTEHADEFRRWLRRTYPRARIVGFSTFMKPSTRAAARRMGIAGRPLSTLSDFRAPSHRRFRKAP